jgi:hypothetical protein
MKHPRGKIIYAEDNSAVYIPEENIKTTPDGKLQLNVRTTGDFKGKGYYLTDLSDWKIITDNEDRTVLVCTKKE